MVYNKKNKVKAMILSLIVIFILSSCQAAEYESISTGGSASDNPVQQTQGQNHYTVEVRGLVLKYVLIDTAYELYQVNVEKDQAFSRSSYASISGDAEKHYMWLSSTYNSLTEQNKAYLRDMFESGMHAWGLMNITTQLDDSSNIDEVVNLIISNKEIDRNKKLKEGIMTFLPYFYSNHLKRYVEENRDKFEQYASKVNNQIKEKNPDVIGFMEKESGIAFKAKYKPVFYYTLRPVGAMGFSYNDLKISTIQRTCDDYTHLLGTPFHEFSHELFKSFIQSRALKKIAGQMKKDEAFLKMWSEGMDKNYDWVGWCEENLVEGFAKYLEYKYYGIEPVNAIYVYDYGFYKYLKAMGFDGQKDSLKETCISFYKETLSSESY